MWQVHRLSTCQAWFFTCNPVSPHQPRPVPQMYPQDREAKVSSPPDGCGQLQSQLLLLTTLQPAGSATAMALILGTSSWVKGASKPESHIPHKGRHPPPATVAMVTTVFHSSGYGAPSPKDRVTMFWHLTQSSKAQAGQRPPHSRQCALSWDCSPHAGSGLRLKSGAGGICATLKLQAQKQ